jgi:antitoxin VapB
MVALNIKNEEAVRLVKELAELKGESMTTVLIEAVQEKLERERKPRINEERMQYFLDLGRQIRESSWTRWHSFPSSRINRKRPGA